MIVRFRLRTRIASEDFMVWTKNTKNEKWWSTELSSILLVGWWDLGRKAGTSDLVFHHLVLRSEGKEELFWTDQISDFWGFLSTWSFAIFVSEALKNSCGFQLNSKPFHNRRLVESIGQMAMRIIEILLHFNHQAFLSHLCKCPVEQVAFLHHFQVQVVTMTAEHEARFLVAAFWLPPLFLVDLAGWQQNCEKAGSQRGCRRADVQQMSR